MSAFSIKRQITYRPHEALERMLNKTTLSTQRVQHNNVIGECPFCMAQSHERAKEWVHLS